MEKFCEYAEVFEEHTKRLIENEFQRIKDEHFLDHAGATLYSEKQISDMFQDLKQNLYGNPHATNVSSQQTEDAIDIIRYRILNHFETNSEEYTVIFTSNATAALKLVAENFNYGMEAEGKCNGTLIYLEDNHTSVLGMRAFNKHNEALSVEEAFEILQCPSNNSEVDEEKLNQADTNSLFVYPAQSNFSGTKYSLNWIEEVKKGQLNIKLCSEKSNNWFVVLDAANFVGTNCLNLSKFKPDFVPISLYKMFGYPTCVGALLVKNSSQEVLKKKYYGGGTVEMALVEEDTVVFRNSLAERYEDGTLAYLSVLSINYGFETLKRLDISMKSISLHTFELSKYVYRNLITLHHSNGRAAVILYNDTMFESVDNQGGIVNFNVVREDGRIIGYSEVMNMANLQKIHLRTGCSCNPGACQRHLKLTSDDVKKHFKAGHVCGDQNDLVDGVPTGSVRVSFGYMSRKEDADALLRMIEDCFVQKPIVRKLPNDWEELRNKSKSFFHRSNGIIIQKMRKHSEKEMNKRTYNVLKENSSSDINFLQGSLENLLLYPIKSCGAFVPPEKSWKLTSSGLEYDRKWMIVNNAGACVTQKLYPCMCLIKPIIDSKHDILWLTFPDEDNISVPLSCRNRKTYRKCESKICKDKVIGIDCGDAVGQWLNRCLGTQGLRLIEQIDNVADKRINKKGENLQLSFANQCQYLLINLASIRWLREKVKETDPEYAESLESMVLRFRPNIVVDFGTPFVENNIRSLDVGNFTLMTAGSCTRCQMICINQVNATKTKEPLITLGKVFGGRVNFGVYLRNFDDVGEEIGSIEIGIDVIGKTMKEVPSLI